MTDTFDRLKTALSDRYTIESELGRGGMAIVYLAHDLKHDRKVAIKVLRPELAASLGADRFLREIKIGANLTHPHILTVLDSGEANGSLYCVMPYVDGESLRDRLNREGKLPIDDALTIAREVADALGYAHEQGVVHRDVKPENILFEAGHAVVADFGIARAIEQAGGTQLTETGMAVGTPAYMSPEQATGDSKVDGRSDIYSLGCVLFEMLGGDPPYMGTTPQAILARKLAEPVPNVSVLRDAVPEAVAQVVKQAMAKDPVDRFATAQEFAQTLQVAHETPEKVKVVRPKRRARLRAIVGSLVAVVPVVATVLVVRTLESGPLAITTSNIVQVTNEPGLEFQPAISPDGEEVAYIVGPIGTPRLVVRGTRDIASGGETRPAPDVGVRHWFPRWTPDGASLRFLACEGANLRGLGSGCGWSEVGKLGGSVRTMSDPRVPGRVAWSRDGTRVAFVLRDSLFTLSADDDEPQLVGVHAVDPFTPHSLSWSPDGRFIAYVNGNPWWRYSSNVLAASIWIVDANGGEPVAVTDHATMNVSPEWLPDNRHLLFVSDRDGPRGIYVVKVGPEGPLGPPRSVPGALDPHSISVSADGRRLAYSRFAVTQNIWAIPIPSSGSASISEAVRVTTGNEVIEEHSLSPDGRWIVYNGTRRGDSDLYKRPLTGGGSQVIVDLPDNNAFDPDWSPDGSEIAFFEGNSLLEYEVRVVSEAGIPQQLLESTIGGVHPDWSSDGLAIAYPSSGGRLWMVSRESLGASWRDPVQLTDFSCTFPDWDPNGASLVCNTGSGLARMSRTGDVLSRHPIAVAWSAGNRPRFSPDGSRIYYAGVSEDGTSGVWWIPDTGGDATQIVTFDDPRLGVTAFLTVGPESLYLTVAEYESDIWVMDLEW